MPTLNKVDLMDCANGAHSMNASGTCEVCGYDAGGERYEALVAACMDLLVVWESNKNLSEVVQRIASELAELSHE